MREGDDKTFALEVALAAPALLWLAAVGAIMIIALVGYRVLAAPADLTLSEAAAIRDGAEVLRQMRAGADPDAPGRIRRGIIRDQEYLMTPLEAATAARHLEVLQLLVRNGAAVNESNFPVLFCLAQESDATDIISFLQEHAPSGVVFECEGVRLPL